MPPPLPGVKDRAMPVVLVGTLDTKGRELAFVRDLPCDAGRGGDAWSSTRAGSIGPPAFPPDIDRVAVFRRAGLDAEAVRREGDRGQAVAGAARGVAAIVGELSGVSGVFGLGGSAGTVIGTAAMRALPFGVPKVMVSTLASGQTRPYVQGSDIMMVYPVADIAGLNRVTRAVLTNAAHALAGMVAPRPDEAAAARDRPLIAATMFGVTTPCVDRARRFLEARGWEVVVFHATGVGGQSLEGLIRDGQLAGVLDLTTTELADELVGGVLSAGPDRLEAGVRRGIPQVVSVGALDMVNFGPWETVPERFADRTFHRHNPSVTLMRTTPEENALLGARMAATLRQAATPMVVMIPLRGVSALDARGQPFYDPEADAALFQALADGLQGHPLVRLDVRDEHINDPAFAEAAGGGVAWPARTAQKPVKALMFQETRSEILSRFRAKVAAGRPIIGGGAGTGLSAKCAEAGGIDLIIIYNSGRYRMAGRGSLAGLMPYGDANAIVMEMAREVLPVVTHTPVLAGVCATDPFRMMSRFLIEVRDTGFAGVQNFPTVGLVDGVFRQGLEETGMGYGLEVEMIAQAREMDLLTCPYVHNEDEARAMAEAGADILVPHVGLTTKGLIGAKSALTLDEAARRVQAMADAARSVRDDVIVLCHGGPIAEPDDVAEVFRKTRGIAGFFGASSVERLPTEPAIIAQVERFAALRPSSG